MTEQHPGAPVGDEPGASHPSATDLPVERSSTEEPFADLERRPVAEHVAVFETEHARLQQELSSIDQL
jgi:hypothetical protein